MADSIAIEINGHKKILDNSVARSNPDHFSKSIEIIEKITSKISIESLGKILFQSKEISKLTRVGNEEGVRTNRNRLIVKSDSGTEISIHFFQGRENLGKDKIENNGANMETYFRRFMAACAMQLFDKCMLRKQIHEFVNPMAMAEGYSMANFGPNDFRGYKLYLAFNAGSRHLMTQPGWLEPVMATLVHRINHKDSRRNGLQTIKVASENYARMKNDQGRYIIEDLNKELMKEYMSYLKQVSPVAMTSRINAARTISVLEDYINVDINDIVNMSGIDRESLFNPPTENQFLRKRNDSEKDLEEEITGYKNRNPQ